MRKSITIDPIAKKRIPNNGEEDNSKNVMMK